MIDLQEIERAVRDPLPHHKMGLQFTASGYGGKIPTEYKIKLHGDPRWYRVYCAIYSNIGTLYILKGGRPEGKNYHMHNVVCDLSLTLALKWR